MIDLLSALRLAREIIAVLLARATAGNKRTDIAPTSAGEEA